MTPPRPTRAECIEAAAEVLAEGYRLMETLPAREVAERAYTPGGPTVDELERQVREWRHEVIDHGDAIYTTTDKPMLTNTPDYVRRETDDLSREYLGSAHVLHVRDDVEDVELVGLHVEAVTSSAGTEVLVGRYAMTPATAGHLATAVTEAADNLDDEIARTMP